MGRLAHGHLLDFQTLQTHNTHYIWKQCHHVVVTHSHVRDNLLERNLLGRIVLILLCPVEGGRTVSFWRYAGQGIGESRRGVA